MKYAKINHNWDRFSNDKNDGIRLDAQVKNLYVGWSDAARVRGPERLLSVFPSFGIKTPLMMQLSSHRSGKHCHYGRNVWRDFLKHQWIYNEDVMNRNNEGDSNSTLDLLSISLQCCLLLSFRLLAHSLSHLFIHWHGMYTYAVMVVEITKCRYQLMFYSNWRKREWRIQWKWLYRLHRRVKCTLILKSSSWSNTIERIFLVIYAFQRIEYSEW